MSSTWLTVVRTDTSRVWKSSWIHFDAKWIINVNCLRWRRGKSQKCKATGDFNFFVLCFFRLPAVELTARVGAPSLADTAERRSCFFFFFPPLQLLLLREADAPDATAHAGRTTRGWPRHGTAQQLCWSSAGAQPHLPLTAAAASPADGTWTPAGQILVSLTARKRESDNFCSSGWNQGWVFLSFMTRSACGGFEIKVPLWWSAKLFWTYTGLYSPVFTASCWKSSLL